MPIDRITNPDLYTTTYNRAIQEGVKDAQVATPALNVLFKHTKSTMKGENIIGMSTLLEPAAYLERNPAPTDTIEELYPWTQDHIKYGRAVDVSFEAIDDEVRKTGSPDGAFLAKTSIFRLMGSKNRIFTERTLEAMFCTPTTGAWADTKPMLATNHPLKHTAASTFSNLLGTTAFSADALQDMERLISQNSFDSKGQSIPLLPYAKYIVYGSYKRNDVLRVINPQTVTADNEYNVYSGRYIPVELPLLTDAAKCYWFIVLDPSALMDGLVYCEREPIHSVAWTDENLEAYMFKTRTRWMSYLYDPRIVWGSMPA